MITKLQSVQVQCDAGGRPALAVIAEESDGRTLPLVLTGPQIAVFLEEMGTAEGARPEEGSLPLPAGEWEERLLAWCANAVLEEAALQSAWAGGTAALKRLMQEREERAWRLGLYRGVRQTLKGVFGLMLERHMSRREALAEYWTWCEGTLRAWARRGDPAQAEPLPERET